MATQVPDSPAPSNVYQFPIRQFAAIPSAQITEAINDLIVELNWALVNAIGGAGMSGVVTKPQLFAAITASALDANLLVQAVNPDYNTAATRQYYTSNVVYQGSALATLVQTTYGLTIAQMNTLFALAATLPPWS